MPLNSTVLTKKRHFTPNIAERHNFTLDVAKQHLNGRNEKHPEMCSLGDEKPRK